MKTVLQKSAELFLIAAAGMLMLAGCNRAVQAKPEISTQPPHLTEKQLEELKLDKELTSLEHEQQVNDYETRLRENKKILDKYTPRQVNETTEIILQLKKLCSKLQSEIALLKLSEEPEWERLESEVDNEMKEFTSGIMLLENQTKKITYKPKKS